MTLVHALSILSLALGQAGGATPPEGSRPADEGDAKASPPPVRIPLAEPRLVPVRPPAQRPQQAAAYPLVPAGAPVLRPDRTSRCFERTGGGRWRAQCDATTKTCLVAPDAELSADGEPRGDLERAPPCVVPGWREDDLAAQGYEVLPALAETPPGWRRDERQRVMQLDFDLGRRFWLGAGYGAGSFPWSDQGEATAGFRADVPFRMGGAPAFARFRVLETYVTFDGDYSDVTVLGVDLGRAYTTPPVHVTTFVGRPRRFDLPLRVGGWLEALRAESIRAESGRWFDRLGVGAAALTLDLWRSRDLASFVRLRGGAGYEIVDQLDGSAWTPQAAADAELTLGSGGFHHVRGTFLSEWIEAIDDFQPEEPTSPRLPGSRRRYTAKAEYEWIFLAVNDQPLSLVVDGRAQSRNDVPELSTRWHFQGTASIRFNLWAPPRRAAAAQERL